MPNSHDIHHPDPDPPPQSIFLKKVGGANFAYAMGMAGTGCATLNNVYAKIFPTQGQATACAPPAAGGGAGWQPASNFFTSGGCQGYEFRDAFGSGDGHGTIPNAAIGPGNYLVAYAFFANNPNLAVLAAHPCVQFNGF